MNDSSPPIALNVDAIVAAARRETGLHDFGSEAFRGPLAMLLQSLDCEAKLSGAGRAGVFADFTRFVSNRLHVEDYFQRHPEIAAEHIERPVFIIGLYRSGTTKLHHLLAADPRWHVIRTWQSLYPAPIDAIDSGARDTRMQRTQQFIDYLRVYAPALLQAHPMAADGPEEEIMLLAHSFLTANPNHSTPTYSRWRETQDAAPMYRYFRRLLQLLQWQARRRGQTPRRFLFKAPVHLEHIETLMAEFPDAKILFTHRNPTESIPSMCRLREALYRMTSDDVDLRELGEETLHYSVRAVTASLAAREQIPAACYHGIHFLDIIHSPLEIVPAIYAQIDETLTDQALSAIRIASDEGDRHKSVGHLYDASRFGLSSERIEAALADYLQWGDTRFKPGRDLRQPSF